MMLFLQYLGWFCLAGIVLTIWVAFVFRPYDQDNIEP